jgi:hypothetical protein
MDMSDRPSVRHVRPSVTSLYDKFSPPSVIYDNLDEISWPSGNRLLQCMADFRDWCGLPGVVGAIDGTHFEIKKWSIAP